MQVRNSEVVHGQKQSWSTLPSSYQTKKTTLVTNWTHALTKTANKTVFEEIKKVLEERMSIEEFKEENISSFILYWQLKNSSSAFLLQENNFTSSSRAAILNFPAKKIVYCCSSCCSSRLYTRRITWETRYPTGRVTRPRVQKRPLSSLFFFSHLENLEPHRYKVPHLNLLSQKNNSCTLRMPMFIWVG